MKLALTLIISISFSFINYSQNDFMKKSEKLNNYLQKLLNDNPEKPVANILCFLENKKIGYTYYQGFGTISLENKQAIIKEQPFKIASITKMFTAVVILQMYEEGLIDLDRPIYQYLENLDFIDFETIHILDGKSYGKLITPRQLLLHRSGLADMFEDTRTQFDEHILNNKQKQWTPKLLFEKYYGFEVNRLSKFEPNTSYAYTDIGYFLLGLCIEQISQKSLAENYRNRILNPLNLYNTYFEYYEPNTSDLELAHAYVKDLDATKEINTSFDWAGGGLVSNTSDLKDFIQSLFENKLFKKEKTLELMINNDMYGFGVSVFHFDKKTYYGHLGFWGSGLFYCPQDEVTISISINQTEPSFDAYKMIKKIIKIIK